MTKLLRREDILIGVLVGGELLNEFWDAGVRLGMSRQRGDVIASPGSYASRMLAISVPTDPLSTIIQPRRAMTNNILICFEHIVYF